MTARTEKPTRSTSPDWNIIIKQAAKRGARNALAEIGLDDQAACRDVRDLRELLTN